MEAELITTKIRRLERALAAADHLAAMAQAVCGNSKARKDNPTPATIMKDNLRSAVRAYRKERQPE